MAKTHRVGARVVRLTNPQAFARPEVQELFKKAFESNKMADFEDVMEELVLTAPDPMVGMFIGAEQGLLRGLCIACLPRSRLTPVPSVYHFYSTGTAKLREALVSATVDFFLEAGYTRFWTINATERSDEAHAKLFRSAGEAKRIGSFLEFAIG